MAFILCQRILLLWFHRFKRIGLHSDRAKAKKGKKRRLGNAKMD